jgi:ribosomal protein L20A (L18A)
MFVERTAKFVKTIGLSSKEDIYEWFHNDFEAEYKGRMDAYDIEKVSKRVTEDICKLLRIK